MILSHTAMLWEGWTHSLGDRGTSLGLKASTSILEVSCELVQLCWRLPELVRPPG